MKAFFLFLFLFPVFIQAQTTLEEIITDMTLAHEGRPHGVPTSIDWALKPRVGALVPPDTWNAAIAWGQLYEWINGNPATNTRVNIKDLEMYYLSKADQKWHLLQKSVGVDGNAYVEDFAGDVNKPADKRIEKDGSVSVKAGGGYNFHFWSKLGRVKYPQGDVAGIYVTVKARLVVDKTTLPDDRDKAKYLMSVGGDWWLSLTAPWDNWKTNWDMGISRFRYVNTEWKSYNMCSVPAAKIRENPPPFVALTTSINDLEQEIPEMIIYPNPVKSSTSISFSLEEKHDLNLSIYNVYGKKIKTLHDGQLFKGNHQITWDTSGLSSGIYFVRMENSEYAVVKKCQILN
jgi:hypothetical protein